MLAPIEGHERAFVKQQWRALDAATLETPPRSIKCSNDRRAATKRELNALFKRHYHQRTWLRQVLGAFGLIRQRSPNIGPNRVERGQYVAGSFPRGIEKRLSQRTESCTEATLSVVSGGQLVLDRGKQNPPLRT